MIDMHVSSLAGVLHCCIEPGCFRFLCEDAFHVCRMPCRQCITYGIGALAPTTLTARVSLISLLAIASVVLDSKGLWGSPLPSKEKMEKGPGGEDDGKRCTLTGSPAGRTNFALMLGNHLPVPISCLLGSRVFYLPLFVTSSASVQCPMYSRGLQRARPPWR